MSKFTKSWSVEEAEGGGGKQRHDKKHPRGISRKRVDVRITNSKALVLGATEPGIEPLDIEGVGVVDCEVEVENLDELVGEEKDGRWGQTVNAWNQQRRKKPTNVPLNKK